MLSIFIILFSFPSIVFSIPVFFNKLPLPPLGMGPESLAFDSSGQGPYTSIGDGRTIKYQGPSIGFQDYAFNSPNRSKAVCDGNTNPALGPICGRPLGIGFNYITRELYICDAHIGLLAASPNGRLARLLATGAEGVPFLLPDGLDVDQLTGAVYFTDASANFTLSEINQAIANNDSTGRLLKYDPNTKNVTVLLRGLSGPAGVAFSIDGSYVLFTEYIGMRIQKYWLRGPKANTSEILVSFPGRPDNIKRTISGYYWVALNLQTTSMQANTPTAIKINANGKILVNVSLSQQYNSKQISEVQERDGSLYIGSRETDFVGVYKI